MMTVEVDLLRMTKVISRYAESLLGVEIPWRPLSESILHDIYTNGGVTLTDKQCQEIVTSACVCVPPDCILLQFPRTGVFLQGLYEPTQNDG